MDEAIRKYLAALIDVSGYPPERVDAAIEMAVAIVEGMLGRPMTDDEAPQIYVATAMVAANVLSQGEGGPIISETIGSYSYTRSQARQSGFVTPDIDDLLRPWVQATKVYSVNLPTPGTEPYDHE